MGAERLFCSFHLDRHLFGLDVATVQEVIRHQNVTRLPLASPAVRGVINLRGRIVPAVDLRRCLGMGAAPSGMDPANIIVRAAGTAAVSLLVDGIGDVVEAPETAFERTPETLRGVARDLIQGVYTVQSGLLLVLDIGKVLRAAYA
jgi:purine-binding chemotaxis protein CheW